MPDFTYIWLPADHGGAGPGIPPLPEEVADGDRALGTIVDFLSHQPTWNPTAIFITPDDAQSSRDHVSEHRTYAVVVSPYAKRRYHGRRALSTVSILKTEEELLGLAAAFARAICSRPTCRAFFTGTARSWHLYRDSGSDANGEHRRAGVLLPCSGETDQSGPDADVERSARSSTSRGKPTRSPPGVDPERRRSMLRTQRALYQAAAARHDK